MKKIAILLTLFLASYSLFAQKNAVVRESKKAFTTYGFSDPNPIAEMGKVYPYYRFDGYTDKGEPKEWKVVELENDFIKVMVLPEIGGKIWAAWEKSTGKPFIYYNQVVKFRDVAMRGPWTSGGIEANYGIIGHTPNCATPMDYATKTNPDGSASCFIGTLDLLTQTYWTVEINVPKDKAYFTTRSFWNNTTSIEQPYYTWMNVGMPAGNDLEFIYPGNRYIGHSGEYSDWPINADNGKDISLYRNNDFGVPKSYHVIGKYSDFFGAYYHDQDFGMARYSLRNEKPGRKIWIWGLSRNGMIWENLLTDKDGQYVEVQSGRLFNQASDGSNLTPFKQLGFAPHTTDEWTEYWFPVKGTQGFVKANEYGALNLHASKSSVRVDFFPLQNIDGSITISEGEKIIYDKEVQLKTLQNFSDSIAFDGNVDNLTVTVAGRKLVYSANPKDAILSRPVESPADFDWNSAFGLYTQGKEFIQQRYYARAKEKLEESLAIDSNYLPALADLAMIYYRNLDYEKALAHATHALSIDTYDPAANFYYGLASAQLGKIADAKDGFDIATLSPAFRGAAFTELSRIYFQEKDFDRARHFATRSLESNAGNTMAWEILAVIGRSQKKEADSQMALQRLEELSPLNHFVRFEKFRRRNSDESKREFATAIRNELPHETYQHLADFYTSLGLLDDAAEVLMLSPQNPEVSYRIAYLKDKLQPGSGKAFIEKGNALSPALVFPFRTSSAEALEWVIAQTQDWKPRYFLGLIYWSRDNAARAKELFRSCGEPGFAPFYAARAELYDDDTYAADLRHAAKIDPGQWRYGKLLAERLIRKKDYAEALKVAADYRKRFPGDFRISMLAAKAMLLNKRYKDVTDLLEKTTILPYEGATDGRQLYREAWLMQAAGQIKSKNYKSALASVEKAKLWPENLGAGKPYDDMIDLRLENYLEGLVYQKMKESQKARQKFEAVTHATSRRHQANDLATALAYRKTGRAAEGEKLLSDWANQQPSNAIAQWARAAFEGKGSASDLEGDTNFRVLRELANL